MKPADVVRALAHAPFFVVLLDRSRRVLWGNRFGYGWTEEATLGKTADEWACPDDRPAWIAARRRVLENGDVVAGMARFRTPDGGPPLSLGYRMARWPGGIILWGWDASGFRAEAAADRTPTERAILAAATTQGQTSRLLASRAGLRYNSRFRGALATLVGDGLLIAANRTYRLSNT